MPSTAQLASYALLTAVGYLATVAISRLLFSRISHIPGPKLAALTHYYQSYYDVYPRQGQFLWQCRQLHKRYGPVVRIGPDEVHVDLPEIYADMYKGHRNKSAVWFWMVGTGEFGDHTVFTTLGHDLHRLRRGALNPYFSKQMVQNLEPRIRGKVMLLKQRMLEYQGTGEPVDLIRIISGMTIDIISQYASGTSAEFLSSPDMGKAISTMLTESVLLHPIGRTFPTLTALLLKFSSFFAPKGSPPAKFKNFVAFLDRLVMQSIAEDRSPRRDLESAASVTQAILHSPNLPPSEKTPERICADNMILIAAGTETTARTLAIALYHVLANPDVHTRLMQELRRLIPTTSSPLPNVAALESSPYLVAVISEGLRMSHGVAGRMARTAPDQDLQIGGYLIPRGTTFSQSTYFIHSNPEIFPDPEKFTPERFLGEGAAKAYKNLHAFGKGSRSCLGMNLAYAEMYLTIAALLAGMDIELFETTVADVTIVKEYFVGVLPADSKGVRVTVKRV